MTWTTCIVCGVPSPRSRCTAHDLSNNKPSPASRGYDSAWRRLSLRARRAQPWCSTCGSTEDLTTDHLRWPARTLADVDVLCRSCNSRKGAAPGRRRSRPVEGVGSGGATAPEAPPRQGRLPDSLRERVR